MAGREPDADAADALPEAPAERVREIVTRVVEAMGLDAVVSVEEGEEEIRARVDGDELGLLIGKHGATIDALQYVAARAAYPDSGTHKAVVVDAAGYRDRRAATLHRAAERAVEDAISFGRPVELEPMSAPERKIVHQYLQDRPQVETYSEGQEPERRLVVAPAPAA